MRSPSGGGEASWGETASYGYRARGKQTCPDRHRQREAVGERGRRRNLVPPRLRRSDFIEDQASNTRDRQRGRAREDGGIEQRHASNIATI
jgi:hypothetical protein